MRDSDFLWGLSSVETDVSSIKSSREALAVLDILYRSLNWATMSAVSVPLTSAALFQFSDACTACRESMIVEGRTDREKGHSDIQSYTEYIR